MKKNETEELLKTTKAIEKMLEEQQKKQKQDEKVNAICFLLAMIIAVAIWIFLYGWKC